MVVVPSKQCSQLEIKTQLVPPRCVAASISKQPAGPRMRTGMSSQGVQKGYVHDACRNVTTYATAGRNIITYAAAGRNVTIYATTGRNFIAPR